MAPIARQRRPRGEPAAQRIVAAAPLAAPRSLVQAVALPDDRVLRFGGDAALGVPTASGELYEPVRGDVTVAPMHAPRAWHTVHRLADGRVLIVGGEGEGGAYVPQVLVYE